ncbi:MAG: fibronectin type III domain-containing protein, partial [Ignavibacterium sp.]|uniref:fibronectin type III domain-containing protein n=1 Tax=Ignavibacterium sp. TaxID=2651167 RepID=UPI00404A9B51
MKGDFNEYKFFFLILILISLIFTFNLKSSSGVNNLDKPSNPVAYSIETSIFLEWKYTYFGLGNVYFEIYEWNGTTWVLKDDTTKYPTTKKTFTSQTIGQHIYKIRAKEKFITTNYSGYTSSIYAYVLKTPTGLKVEHVSNKYDLKFSWNPVDSYADKIEVWRKADPGPDFPSKIATIDKSFTSYIDTTTLANTTYIYYLALRRFDETITHDDFTMTTTGVSLKTYPKGVNTLSGSAQGTTGYLAWTYTNYPSGTTISGFKIYRRSIMVLPPYYTWFLVDTLPNTTFSKSYLDLSYGSHTYQVRTYNSGGESFDNITLTIYVLKSPTNLSTTPLSSNSIRLNWDPVDSNATSIVISKSLNGILYFALTSISSTNTSYIDTDCSPNTKYWYMIKAKRDLNESSISNIVSTKTPPVGSPPSSPTNLSGVAVNCNQIDLTWQDNAADETSYIVERKIEGGTYSVKATLPANTTIYSDTSVNENTKYYYRVKAKNSFGDSGYSNEINITTPPCGTVPNAPSNLTLTVVSSSQINLSWNDNSDNENGFRIERKIEGGSYSQIIELGANVTSYSDTSLLPNTKYHYRVRSFNSYGNSSYSNEASATTLSLGSAPNAPTNLNVIPISCDLVELNWNDNSDNEDGFKI